MPGFDMSDYVPVNERIEAFKADWPDGSLQSNIVELTESRVTVKAYAYRTADDQRPGIGHSSMVIPGATPYTRGSEIENAETSAWGRAIAALGFEVKRGLASREEVSNKQPQAGERSNPMGSEAPAMTPPVTDPEVIALKRVEWAAQFGWSGPALRQAALDATNVALGELETDDWRIFAAAVVKAGPGLPAQPVLPLDQGTDAGSDSLAEPEDTSAPEPEAVAPPSAPPVPPAEPPQPGTDEYKALPVQEKAKARAHWAQQVTA